MLKVREVIIQIYDFGFRILNHKYNNENLEIKIRGLKF